MHPGRLRALVLCAAVGLCGCKPARLPGESLAEVGTSGGGQTAGSESMAMSSDAVVIAVNGEEITVADFDRWVGALPPITRMMFDTPERRPALLELMVGFRVLGTDAAATGLAGSLEEEIRVDEARLHAWLTATAAREMSMVDISEADVTARYERDRLDLSLPARREASLLVVGDRAEAVRVRDEIGTRMALRYERPAAVFERAAREYSLHAASRDNGGRLGLVAPAHDGGVANPEVLAAVFATALDTVSEPFAVAGGWALVMPTAELEAVPRDESQWEPLLRSELHAERVAERSRAALDTLRTAADLQIDAAVVASLAAARRDGGPSEPSVPRRFERDGLADDPLRSIGYARRSELEGLPEWLAIPRLADLGRAPLAGSGDPGGAAAGSSAQAGSGDAMRTP